MAAVARTEPGQVEELESRMEQAATLIQAHYRRHRAEQQYRRQQKAAHIIQAQTLCFLERRKAARDHEQAQKAARFKAVMARHHERIQQLELEKRRIRELPLDQLDAYQAKRQAAATVIQACWRGSKQRQLLRDNRPGLMTLRPVTCTSPTMMDHTPSSLPDQHQPTHLKQSLIAARQSAAPAGMHGCDSSEHHEAPKKQPSICCPELPAESSTMSVLSVAAMDGTDKPKRREVIPAARRMVLERQVQLRIDAFRALHDGSHKLAALRAGKETTDQRLAQLLQEHQAAAPGLLKAARRRQKLLHKAEALYCQLQQLPQLSQLPEDPRAVIPPAVAADGEHGEKARQAHALALAEAKVGSHWWLPLDALNKQHMLQHRNAAENGDVTPEQQEWRQMEASWKANWDKIMREQHGQQPTPIGCETSSCQTAAGGC